MKRSAALAGIILIILCYTPIFAAGELDTTFNMTGRVKTRMGSANDWAEGIATQIDGKIVVVGYSNNAAGNGDFAVLRFNPDGTPDSTFNGTGKLLKQIGAGDDYATGLAIQPDGKIVVGGYSFNGQDDDIVVMRLNPNGALDGSFGSGGIAMINISGYDRASALELQYDGKIVVAGSIDSSKSSGMAIIRFNSNGTLDTGFGTGGRTVDDGIPWTFGARDIKIRPDGKIVVAGEGFNNSTLLAVFAAARYLPNGAPDTTFNSTGKVFTQMRGGFNRAFSVALGEDGTMLLGGGSSDGEFFSDYTTARYRSDGSLDPNFGSEGVRVTHVGDWINMARAVLIQQDGKILLGGTRFAGFDAYQNFGVVRYQPNGSLDTAFGACGLVDIDWESGSDNATAMELQPDGKILVAGNTYDHVTSETSFAMVRLLGDLPFPYAGVAGQVTDLQGTGIGNAKVTITNMQNGETRTLSTSPFGYFIYNLLPVNYYYQVRVSSKGRRFVTPRTFRLLGNINGLSITPDSD